MKRAISILICMVIVFTATCFAESSAALQEMYADAELLMAQGDYAGAASKFEALGTYSDSSQMAMYAKAIYSAETAGMYDVAVDAFNGLGDFKDSKQMAVYYEARGLEAAGDAVDLETATVDMMTLAQESYEKAVGIYSGLALFKDSIARLSGCNEKVASIEAKIPETIYNKALEDENNQNYPDAIRGFSSIKAYSDSSQHLEACQAAYYEQAVELEKNGKYAEAKAIYEELKDYKDSKDRASNCEYLSYTVFDAINDTFSVEDVSVARAMGFFMDTYASWEIVGTEEMEQLFQGTWLHSTYPNHHMTYYYYGNGERTSYGDINVYTQQYEESSQQYTVELNFENDLCNEHQIRKVMDSIIVAYRKDENGEYRIPDFAAWHYNEGDGAPVFTPK